MLTAIYKSPKKEGMYLYLNKRDDFERVPEVLLEKFGSPIFVMMIKMEGRQLAQVDIEKVKKSLLVDGFFLQVPPPPVDLLKEHKERKAKLRGESDTE